MVARLFNTDDRTDISIETGGPQHQKSANSRDSELSSFVIQHDFSDVDELAEVAHSWDLDFRQLNRGGFHGDLIHAGGPGLIMSRTRLQGVLHQFGASPPGLCTFALSTNETINLRWRGHEVGKNQILAYPTGGNHESISHPDFDMVLLSLSEESLDAAQRRLGIAGTDALSTKIEIASCGSLEISRLRKWIFHKLAEVIRSPDLLDDPEHMKEAVIEASDLLVQAIVAGTADLEHFRSTRQRRQLDYAVHLARSSSQRIHTVAELSLQTGISRRTLQRGFQERFGVSPKAYLMAQRLIGTRRDLRISSPTIRVTDAANNWGFWHIGQFAADYRTMFGEFPSQTLKSAGGQRARENAPGPIFDELI